MAAGRAPYRSRIILILLVLVSLPCSAALTDFERITKIGAEWGIASYWPGVCPGNCNSSPPWPGLQWQGTNLTRLYVLRIDWLFPHTCAGNSTAMTTLLTRIFAFSTL